MWQNLRIGKMLKGVKVTYKVKGLNQDRLIEKLKKQGIVLCNLKKVDNKLMYISVNLNQSKKFFAITKELCYNVKRIRNEGKGAFFYYLLKNAGLIVGAIVFVVALVVCNDYVFRIDFHGSGAVYQREVREYLYSQGVKERAKFSTFSLQTVEDGILASNPNITFASAVKKGNTLSVYLVSKVAKPQVVEKVSELKSTVNGVVERVKVYRGRALVKEGDSVEIGQLLVDGQVQIKEQTLSMNVLACVTVRVQESFVCTFDNKDSGDLAIIYATEHLGEKEIVDTKVSVQEILTENGLNYQYTVQTQYLCQLYAGLT